MNRVTSILLIGIALIADPVSAADRREDRWQAAPKVEAPVLLARFDDAVSSPRTLYLYCSVELGLVHVWLRDAWITAKKVRDASSEEPYFAYRVSRKLEPREIRTALVNGWSQSGDVAYRYQLEFQPYENDYRVAVEPQRILSHAEYAELVDRDKTESSLAESKIPHAPMFPTLAPECAALMTAVRETGAESVRGQLDPELVQMASRYAERMARQQRQDGHAGWTERFHYLTRPGGGGRSASEITAESWGHLGESLDAHARSCVESWLQSPGHRAEMMGAHERYGYAMARGENGVYYAVGIFVN